MLLYLLIIYYSNILIEYIMFKKKFKEKNPYYRIPSAQDIHTSILKYINGKNELNKVKEVLCENINNQQALKQLSKSGDSHINDILHLPFSILKKDRKQALELSESLFDLFMEKVQDLQIIKYWFLHRNENGFMPIHDILRYGSTKNLKTYFSIIDQMKKYKIINISEYKILIFGTKEDNFSPLHAGIENVKVTGIACIKLYLKKIDGLIKSKEKLYVNSYIKLLTRVNKHKVSLYQQCLISGEKEILRLLFERIMLSYFSNKQRKKMYLEENNDGFSCLHSAAETGKKYFLSFHLQVLQIGIQHKIITKLEYKNQLISKTSNGDSPLHILLEKGNLTSLNLYFRTLDEARKNSIINNDEYMKLMFAQNDKNFNTIHKATLTKTKNPCILKALIENVFRCNCIRDIIIQSEAILIESNKFRFILYFDGTLIKIRSEKNKQYLSIKEINNKNNAVLLAVIKDKLWDIMKNFDDELFEKIAKCIEEIITHEKFTLNKLNQLLFDALEQKNEFGYKPGPKRAPKHIHRYKLSPKHELDDKNITIIKAYLTKLRKSFVGSYNKKTNDKKPDIIAPFRKK